MESRLFGFKNIGGFGLFSCGYLTRYSLTIHILSHTIQPVWIFCVCFPRKFTGLKVKVYFVDRFGCWVYWFSGFGYFARDLGLVLCWRLILQEI